MKICFLLPAHWSGILGGAELQVRYIMDFLQKKGYDDIYYICRSSTMDQDGSVKIKRVKHNSILAKYVFFVDHFQVYRLLKEISPDVIYTRVDAAYVGMAAYYCKHHPCKLVWHIAHQIDVEPYKIKTRRDIVKYPDRKIFEYGIKNADAIIGQAQYQDVLLQKNFKRKCSAIIPNFHPAAGKIEKKASPIKIVWIANIKPIKQPELFIELAKALSQYDEVEFMMVGYIQDKAWEEKLKSYVSQTSNLTYLGGLPIEEVNELLASSHIFVNTSESEGFPNSFIQSWLRKAVVVSLNVDPDNVIKNNDLGYISGSFEQLVEDVRYLLQHPDERKELSEKSYAYAMEHYSLSNIAKLLHIIKN